MKKSIFLISLLCGVVVANETDLDDFLQVFEEETELATKNKIGADYAPGIITVLESEELERLGIRDFYEALKFVAGVDVDINNLGTRNIVMRGLGSISGSGKTKIMINGVIQNSVVSGNIHVSLPIALIDRIEIIRGPVSALYGEYAFSGAINIVTKKEKNMLSYRAESTSNLYSALASYSSDELSFNLVTTYDDIYGDAVDSLAIPNTGFVGSNRQEESIIGDIHADKLSLSFMYNKGVIKNSLETPFALGNGTKTFEASYDFEFGEDFSIKPKVGYMQNCQKQTGTAFYPLDETICHSYDKRYANVDVHYKLGDHELLLGAEYFTIKESDDKNEILNLETGEFSYGDGLHDVDERSLMAFYMQDNITLSPSFGFHLGARYDSYKDDNNDGISSRLSPRIAGVYELNEKNIFKAQYSESFRVSNFFEQSQSVKPEINKMLEFQHIFKMDNFSFKNSLYYAFIEDLIIPVAYKTFDNSDEKLKNLGFESELKVNFDKEFLLVSNLSYTSLKSEESKADFVNYTNWLANIGLSHNPYANFSSSVWARYVGNKYRHALDTSREEMEDMMRFDMSFRYMPEELQGLKVLFGVKNIFDEELKSPSDPLSYQGDLLVQKRRYFLDVSYEF